MNAIDGLHLLVDGNVSEPALFKEEVLAQMFQDLVESLQMELIFGPVFKDVILDPSKLTGDVFQDEGGLSCFCMISTSHCAIHCWPLRKTFMADIFSCRPFDTNAAIGILEKHLRPSGMHARVVARRPDVVC